MSIADTEPFTERLRREHHVRDISDDQAFSGRVWLYSASGRFPIPRGPVPGIRALTRPPTPRESQ